MSCIATNSHSFHEPRYPPLQSTFIEQHGDVPVPLKRSLSSGGYIPYHFIKATTDFCEDLSTEALPTQCQLTQCRSRSASPWPSRSRNASPCPYEGLSRSTSPCPYYQHPSSLTTQPPILKLGSSNVKMNGDTQSSFDADTDPSRLHSLPLISTSAPCEVFTQPDFDTDLWSPCASPVLRPWTLPIDLDTVHPFDHESVSRPNDFALPVLAATVRAPSGQMPYVSQHPNFRASPQTMLVDPIDPYDFAFEDSHEPSQQAGIAAQVRHTSLTGSFTDSRQVLPKWQVGDGPVQHSMAVHNHIAEALISSWGVRHSTPSLMPPPQNDANVAVSKTTLSLEYALESAAPRQAGLCQTSTTRFPPPQAPPPLSLACAIEQAAPPIPSLPPSCEDFMHSSHSDGAAYTHISCRKAIKRPASFEPQKQGFFEAARAENMDMCASDQPVTTLMIQNLPRQVTQRTLTDELNNSGFEGTYDFAYMPSSFHNNENAGFAFVNFMDPCMAGLLVGQWHRKRLFGIDAKQPALNISAAVVQGFKANLKKWATPRLRRIKNQGFRPLFLDDRTQTLRSLTDEVFDQVVNGMLPLQ